MRLGRNHGCGVARQAALDKARGKYLAFLDADDWWYPQKLAHQVRTFERYPELRALTSRVAVVDNRGLLWGMLGSVPHCADEVWVSHFDKLGPPPFPFGPTMVRTADARSIGFDRRFDYSEDSDFLVRLALGYDIGVVRGATYAYSAIVSRTVHKVVEGFRWRRGTYRRFLRRYPLRVLRLDIECRIKSLVYRGVYRLRLEREFFKARLARPSEEDVAAFLSARDAVWRSRSEIWPSGRQIGC